MIKNKEIFIELLIEQVKCLESVLSEQCKHCEFARDSYIMYTRFSMIKDVLEKLEWLGYV